VCIEDDTTGGDGDVSKPSVPQSTSQDEVERRERLTAPAPRRINVAINAEMLAAIDRVIEREKVTLTEAVRRLITYGDFVYRAVKDDHATIVLRTPNDGSEREVVLV